MFLPSLFEASEIERSYKREQPCAWRAHRGSPFLDIWLVCLACVLCLKLITRSGAGRTLSPDRSGRICSLQHGAWFVF